MGDWYTWKEFKDEVLSLRPLDKSRLIQGDDGTYLEKLIRRAVIDLQQFIPVYRKGHETIYEASDFATEGKGSRAVLPPQSEVRDAWMFDQRSNTRHPMLAWPWAKRFELTTGCVSVTDNDGKICLDPYGYTFYAYPLITSDWLVSVFWDGQKIDFADDEEVPFDEGAAQAASDYVAGMIALHIEKDIPMHEEMFRNHPTNPGSYILKRRNLYLSAKERTRVKQ